MLSVMVWQLVRTVKALPKTDGRGGWAVSRGERKKFGELL
jgi:hypothetical protein